MLNNKLSIFIITKNEQDRISSAINSIKNIADEIIVIDSGSTDSTKEIAESLNAKVIYNEWKGYGQQKIFGEQQCKNDWILNIDADETLTPEIQKEIKEFLQSGKINQYHAAKIKIANQFPLEKKPKRLAYSYNQIRLYNKDHASFKNSTIHDSVALKTPLNSKIYQFKHKIAHQSFRSIEHWINKINEYSNLQAIDSCKKQKIPSKIKILLAPTIAFLKAYIIRRYFIYGVDGVIYSRIYAFSRLAKIAKIRECDYRATGDRQQMAKGK